MLVDTKLKVMQFGERVEIKCKNRIKIYEDRERLEIIYIYIEIKNKI